MNLHRTLLILATTVSASSLAHPVVETLSTQLITQQLPTEHIEQQLDEWYQIELKQLDRHAQRLSDRIPINERRKMAQASLEQEYQSLKLKLIP